MLQRGTEFFFCYTIAVEVVRFSSRLCPVDGVKGGDFLFCLYCSKQAKFLYWGDKQHMAAQKNYTAWIYGLVLELSHGDH
jgi:hypothetical protein